MPKKRKIPPRKEEIEDLLSEYWKFAILEDYPNTKTITKVLDALEKEIRKLK